MAVKAEGTAGWYGSGVTDLADDSRTVGDTLLRGASPVKRVLPPVFRRTKHYTRAAEYLPLPVPPSGREFFRRHPAGSSLPTISVMHCSG